MGDFIQYKLAQFERNLDRKEGYEIGYKIGYEQGRKEIRSELMPQIVDLLQSFGLAPDKIELVKQLVETRD